MSTIRGGFFGWLDVCERAYCSPDNQCTDAELVERCRRWSTLNAPTETEVAKARAAWLARPKAREHTIYRGKW
jgi:hypothetical protein